MKYKKLKTYAISVWVLLMVLILITTPGCKDPARGKILVSVVDGQLTPVAGVSVTVTRTPGVPARKARKITSSKGTCIFSSLPPANDYVLEFARSGFVSQSRKWVKVKAREQTYIRIIFQVNAKAIPGRWRIAKPGSKKDKLSPEQKEAKERLETLGYLAGHKTAPVAKNVTSYDKTKAYKGLNLYCSGHAPEAILLDMEGNQLHRWRYDITRVWKKKYDPMVPGHQFWRRVHLLENGDLLAIFEGYGLIKLDKDSNLIWSFGGKAHHDLFVMPDYKIYVLTREGNIIPKYNKTEMILEDFISILSPGGKEIRRVSILECLENSKFAPLLDKTPKKGDILHTNTLEVLEGKLAHQSPAFKRGNVLISILYLDLICVVDMDKESVVWGMSGMWKRQHQPTILDNGTMLIFDNHWKERELMSRVLVFDPFSKQILWEYPGTMNSSFYTGDCGSCQPLPNGNTLISETNAGRAFEVTPHKTIAWEFYNPQRAGKNNELIACLFEMIRIDPGYNLDWLKAPAKKYSF